MKQSTIGNGTRGNILQYVINDANLVQTKHTWNLILM